MKKWMGSLIFLTGMILLCALAVRFLTRGETLAEYAKEHPEIAYASPKKTDSPKASPGNIPDNAVSPEKDSSGKNTEASPAETPSPGTSQEGTDAAPAPDPVSDSPAGAVSDSASPMAVTEQETADSTHYQEGFFYQPLTDAVVARITGISYPITETLAPTLSLRVVNIVPDDETLAITYDDLRYLNVLYYDFEGQVQTGELICNKGIAQDLVEIFYELYLNEYQIEKIRLIDAYGGDDTASMLDNNTSCFNYRVVDGTSSLSKHALGCAIDINPFYNPYVVFNRGGTGETYISPPGSEQYADRTQSFPYKIDETDLCYKLFTAHGFIWGGNWNSSKDYQHFQKVVN